MQRQQLNSSQQQPGSTIVAINSSTALLRQVRECLIAQGYYVELCPSTARPVEILALNPALLIVDLEDLQSLCFGRLNIERTLAHLHVITLVDPWQQEELSTLPAQLNYIPMLKPFTRQLLLHAVAMALTDSTGLLMIPAPAPLPIADHQD